MNVLRTCILNLAKQVFFKVFTSVVKFNPLTLVFNLKNFKWQAWADWGLNKETSLWWRELDKSGHLCLNQVQTQKK